MNIYDTLSEMSLGELKELYHLLQEDENNVRVLDIYNSELYWLTGTRVKWLDHVQVEYVQKAIERTVLFKVLS